MACCCGQRFACGPCTSIPATLQATISSESGNYLDANGCVFGSASLSLTRPGQVRKKAPAGCWNSGTVLCNESPQADLWTSGVDPSVGGMLYYRSQACTNNLPPPLNSAYYLSQMYAQCDGNQILFGFSCGKNPRSSSGCPDAFDAIGSPVFGFPNQFSYVSLLLPIISCEPFLAIGATVGRAVNLTVTLSANPLP